jgi:two-component system, cell cycle response regulator DivK
MRKTVMIVEDNELNMKLFHDLLEAYGYRTIGTASRCPISPASTVPI